MKICILGAGNMGGWLVEALKEEHEIAVFDPDMRPLHRGDGVTQLRGLAEVKEQVPEMLVNAVSLRNTEKAFQDVLTYLPDDCILCDVASVKGTLPDFYSNTGMRFVSLHPMFGPTFAKMEDLNGENAVLIKESDPQGKDFWRVFFRDIGVTVFEYPFSEHDPMMAYSLTLPFVSSLVFSSCVSLQAVPGTTFRKHIEVARGLLGEDDYLLTEILFNRESLNQLKDISGRLNHLWHIIDQKDSDEAAKFIGALRQNLFSAA